MPGPGTQKVFSILVAISLLDISSLATQWWPLGRLHLVAQELVVRNSRLASRPEEPECVYADPQLAGMDARGDVQRAGGGSKNSKVSLPQSRVLITALMPRVPACHIGIRGRNPCTRLKAEEVNSRRSTKH